MIVIIPHNSKTPSNYVTCLYSCHQFSKVPLRKFPGIPEMFVHLLLNTKMYFFLCKSFCVLYATEV